MTVCLRAFAAVAAAFLTLVAASATAESADADPLLQGRIAEGLFFDGQLWLRGALTTPKTGPLVSVNPASGTRTAHMDKGVIDIDAGDGTLWGVRQATESARTFTIFQWKDGAFSPVGNLPAGTPQPIAIAVGKRNVFVLTPVSLHIFDKALSRWQKVRLRGALRFGTTFSAAMTRAGNMLYFGANNPPGGGTLQRIDVSNGVVNEIESKRSAQPCDGPLVSNCSPVTAVIPDPEQAGCVLAAIGLANGEVTDGRVVRVCGDTVTVVFEQRTANQPANSPIAMTEPVFGLAAAADGFWAVDRSALHRFKAGAVSDMALPAPAPVAGTAMGTGVSGVVAIPTAVDSAVSVSGVRTLVVATEGAVP